MKNLIATLSLSFLTLSTITGNLSSNLKMNQQAEVSKNILNKDIKKISNSYLSSINNENDILKNLIKNNFKTVKGGKNYYKYYFMYHVIWFDHDLTTQINNNLALGVGTVVGIISAAFPPAALPLAVIAPLLIAQWKLWKIEGHDHGNGVVISIFGLIPTLITGVWSQ